MRDSIDFIPFMNKKMFAILEKDQRFKTFKLASSTHFCLIYNLDNPTLKNKTIRKALHKSIDKQALVNRVLHNGIVKNSKKENTCSPQTSLRLLKQEGWRLKIGALLKNGKQFTIELLVQPNVKILELIALELRQAFNDVGIKLIINFSNTPPTKTETIKNFQLMLVMQKYDDIWEFTIPSIYTALETSNASDKFVREITSKISQSLQTTSPDEKELLLNQINKKITDLQIKTVLFSPIIYFSLPDKYTNIAPYFKTPVPVRTLKNWRLKEYSK